MGIIKQWKPLLYNSENHSNKMGTQGDDNTTKDLFIYLFLIQREAKEGGRVTYLLSCLFENNMQKGKNNLQLTTVFLASCLI